MTHAAATPTESILEWLDIDRAALLAAAARVPSHLHTERAEPTCWSAVEVLEHVAMVDTGIARIIAACAAKPLTATAEELAAAQLTDARRAWVRNRETRVDAPARVKPQGNLTMEEALERLAKAREELKRTFVSTEPAALDGALFPHPFLGPVTVRGWVEIAAHHNARHAKQLDELLAALTGRRD